MEQVTCPDPQEPCKKALALPLLKSPHSCEVGTMDQGRQDYAWTLTCTSIEE